MQTENKFQLAIVTSELTVRKAVEGDKLIKLKLQIGYTNLLKVVATLIYDVVEWYALAEDKKMKQTQVIQLAQMIITDYKYYSLEDLALCFNEGKKGAYGKHYQSIDGTLVLSWLKIFDQKRDEVLERLNKVETPKEPIIPVFVAKNLYGKFGKEIIEKKEFDEKEFKRQKLDYLKNRIIESEEPF